MLGMITVAACKHKSPGLQTRPVWDHINSDYEGRPMGSDYLQTTILNYASLRDDMKIRWFPNRGNT